MSGPERKSKQGGDPGVCGGEQVPSEVRDNLTAKVIFVERSVGEKGGSCGAMESYVRDVRPAGRETSKSERLAPGRAAKYAAAETAAVRARTSIRGSREEDGPSEREGRPFKGGSPERGALTSS